MTWTILIQNSPFVKHILNFLYSALQILDFRPIRWNDYSVTRAPVTCCGTSAYYRGQFRCLNVTSDHFRPCGSCSEVFRCNRLVTRNWRRSWLTQLLTSPSSLDYATSLVQDQSSNTAVLSWNSPSHQKKKKKKKERNPQKFIIISQLSTKVLFFKAEKNSTDDKH